jgi:hypothetical protein
MVSVMAIKSEVFGECVEEIDVSVEVGYGCGELCCGREYLRLICVRKAAQDWRNRLVIVLGVRYSLGASGDV